MSIEDLILNLRVEEDHRKGENVDVLVMEAKANIVEVTSPKPKLQKNKGKKGNKKIVNPYRPKGKDFKKIN